MLEQLFGSKTRVKLLQLFLNNSNQPYYLRELARKLKTQLNSVRREVENMEKLGIVKSIRIMADTDNSRRKKRKNISKGGKKYLLTNIDFILFHELKALFMKAQLMLEKNFITKLEGMHQVKILILTGIFVGLEDSSTDMLVVGSANHKKISKIVKGFEKELNREIRYTIMTKQEYEYRKDITDHFLYDILEGKKIVIVDRLNEK